MKKNINLIKHFTGMLFMTAICLSCTDIFDKEPLDKVSDSTFWQTEQDAELALTGCYINTGGSWNGEDFWTPRSLVHMDLAAGNGSEKEGMPDHITDGSLISSNFVIEYHWKYSFAKIATCNNFLDHINDIQIDEKKRERMKSEVRVLRAYEYFNLALYFGDVPLVTKIQTLEEANNVVRTAKQDVWNFVEQELVESADILPMKVADSEKGHMTAAAALGILGRLYMAEQKWHEAASAYKRIMDSDKYSIDPRFKELFWEAGEFSPEIVMSSQYVENDYSHALLQFLVPEAWGGWHQYSPYNELVKEFECIDGNPIDESPLYDKDNPYENRDPRLDYTVMINQRTVFKGKTFISEPNSGSPDVFTKYKWSGYAINKFMDENFNGNLANYGGDFSLIRYAEVLLGYLESKLESGENVTQSLLDETINLVRGRKAVNMPSVTETNAAKLRTIIRRERRVEFAFEGLRYYDILRWGIAAEELNRQFTGMKLTNDPAHYNDYEVDEEGYLIYQKKEFKKGVNELWPIPLSEIQINPNLTQNSGY